MITFLQVLNRPEESDTPAVSRPTRVEREPRTVPPSPEARRVVAQFVNTAVARQDLAHAWRVSGPGIRQGLTFKEWMSGEIPVVPFDIDPSAEAPVRLEWSYPTEASFQVVLVPRRESTDEIQAFYVTVKKFGRGKRARWLVDYWAPTPGPARAKRSTIRRRRRPLSFET